MQVGFDRKSSLESASNQIESIIVPSNTVVIGFQLLLVQLFLVSFDLILGVGGRLGTFTCNFLIEGAPTSLLQLRTVNLGTLTGVVKALGVILNRGLCHVGVLYILHRTELEWIDWDLLTFWGA